MNKIKYLSIFTLTAICLMTFTACSSDDDDGDTVNPKSLIGTWQTQHIAGYTYDDDYNIIPIDEYIDEDDADRIEFKENGQVLSYEKNGDSWELYDDSTLYSLSSSNLNLYDVEEGEWYKCYIKDISSTTLVLENTLEGTSYKTTITLSKVN